MSPRGGIWAKPLFFALVLVVSVAPSVAAGPVGPNIQVSAVRPPVHMFEAPLLAAQGRRVALAVSDFVAKSCELWFSSDEGATWERRASPHATSPGTNCGTESASIYGTRALAMAPDGTLLYAYSEDGVEFVVRSRDEGRTWTAAFEPTGTGTSLATALGGNAYASWLSNGALFVAHSPDGGATFSDPVEAVPSSSRPGGGRLAVSPDGDVYLFYIDRSRQASGFGPALIAVAVSRDRGATWVRTIVAEVPANAAFSTQVPVGAVDAGTGEVFVTWADVRNGLYPGLGEGNLLVRDWDVFASASSDAGETWSPAIRVNDNPLRDAKIQYRPWIAAGGGRVYIAWYDYRHDPAGGNGFDAFDQPGLADVFVAFSEDGAQSFSANRRITDYSINRFHGTWSCCFIQAPLNLVPLASGVLAAWSDTRLGNALTGSQDIFAAAYRPRARTKPRIEKVGAGRRRAFEVLSRLAFPAGGTFGQANGDHTDPTVVVAPKGDIALQLVAATLARDRGGSLLLSGPEGLSAAARREVTRLLADRAYMVGDESQLGAKVEQDLHDLGVDDVSRVSGSDRFDTAREAASIIAPVPSYWPTARPEPDNTAVVVAGDDDLSRRALRRAASAAGIAPMLDLPVLLVTKDGVPPPTRRAVSESGIVHTIVVASEKDIPDDVVQQLPDPIRISRGTPAATSRAVAEELLRRGGPANVVVGVPLDDPSVGILAGAAAGRIGAVTLLLPPAALRGRTPESPWLDRRRQETDRIYVFRGR